MVARPDPGLALLLAAACSTEEVRIAHPPTAFAGFEATVGVGEEVVLDGTRSVDPDGDRLGYAWRLVARPVESIAEVVEPASPLARLTPDRAGTYVLSLSVSDGDFTARDLLGLTAVARTSTAPADLSIALAPAACNADAGRLQDSTCGVSDRRVAVDPVMLVYPEARADEVSIEWTFMRLPFGAGDLSVDTPRGPLGELTFVPPRPGEYWISARLVGPAAASHQAIATLAVFDRDPPAARRPLPEIEAPPTARTGQFVLLDGRGSFVPTSTAGVRPRRTWSLVSDPSAGAAALTDVATGCRVDECRRLVPPVTGTYIVALAIGDGVTAVRAVEVVDP